MQVKLAKNFSHITHFVNTLYAFALIALALSLRTDGVSFSQGFLSQSLLLLVGFIVVLHAWWRQVEFFESEIIQRSFVLQLVIVRGFLLVALIYFFHSVANQAVAAIPGLIALGINIFLLFVISVLFIMQVMAPTYGKERLMIRRELINDVLLTLIALTWVVLLFTKPGSMLTWQGGLLSVLALLLVRPIAKRLTKWKEPAPPHRGGRTERWSRENQDRREGVQRPDRNRDRHFRQDHTQDRGRGDRNAAEQRRGGGQGSSSSSRPQHTGPRDSRHPNFDDKARGRDNFVGPRKEGDRPDRRHDRRETGHSSNITGERPDSSFPRREHTSQNRNDSTSGQPQTQSGGSQSDRGPGADRQRNPQKEERGNEARRRRRRRPTGQRYVESSSRESTSSATESGAEATPRDERRQQIPEKISSVTPGLETRGKHAEVIDQLESSDRELLTNHEPQAKPAESDVVTAYGRKKVRKGLPLDDAESTHEQAAAGTDSEANLPDRVKDWGAAGHFAVEDLRTADEKVVYGRKPKRKASDTPQATDEAQLAVNDAASGPSASKPATAGSVDGDAKEQA